MSMLWYGDVYRHPVYLLSIAVNSSIAMITVGFTVVAFVRLFSQSILHSNTRVFIALTLVFGGVHQICYVVNKLRILSKILTTPSDLFETAYNCRFMNSGFFAANVGLSMSQLDMVIDRLLATMAPNQCSGLKTILSVLLITLTTALSISAYPLVTRGLDLQETILNCAYYPTEATFRIRIVLRTLFCISLFALFLNIAIMMYNAKREKGIRFSTLAERYQHEENRKCTKTVLIITISQCVFSSLYASIMLLMFKLKQLFGEFMFQVVNPFFYLPTYSCLLSPLLVIWMLRRFRQERIKTIHMLTNLRESHEQHISGLNKMWK